MWKIRWFVRRNFYRLARWIERLMPIMCWNCKRFVSPDEIHPVQETTGMWRNLCQVCYNDLFTPYKEKK